MADASILLPQETVRRPPPVGVTPAEERLFEHEYERVLAEAVSWDIEDVTALPNGALMSGARLLPEGFSSAPRGLRAARLRLRAAQYLAFTAEIDLDQAVWITDEYSNGFFHWVGDVLPRLEALAAQGGGSGTLLVPAMADLGYVLPSLEPYGLPAVRVFSWRERVRCGRLQVAGAAAPTGNFRPRLMQALRDRMRSHYGVGRDSLRVYLSRADAPGRRVANEPEIRPVLERFGFCCVQSEKLSFPEQVRLIGSASVLASNHGAGLTHLCWMRPGTTVLELRRRDDRIDNCYFSLAGALGIQYRYLLCSVTNEKQPTHVADVVVDPAALAAKLSELG